MYRKFITCTILLSLILSLTACSSKDNSNNKKSSTPTNTPIASKEVLATPESSIQTNESKLLNCINNIEGIKNGFRVSTHYLKQEDYTSGEYNLSKDYYVTCTNDSGNSFIVCLESKGATDKISSLSISLDSSSDDLKNTMKEWAIYLIESFVNKETAQAISGCTVGNRISDVSKVNDQSISVYVANENKDDTNNGTISTYSIEYKDSSEPKNVTVDSINLSENPDCSIFNTNLLDYNDNLSTLESKIGSLYKYGECKISSIGDMSSSDGSGFKQTMMSLSVTNKDGGHADWRIVTNNVKGKYKVSINVSGMAFDNRKDAYYNAEDLLQFITGNEVKLDSYFDKNNFEIKNVKMNLSNNDKYTVNIKGTTKSNNSKYSIDLDVEG